MTARFNDRPLVRLTRHFFERLFDLGFLSETGSDAFRRVVIGLLAAIISFGMIVTRLFAGKYGYLSQLPASEPYTRAMLGDTALVLALPMVTVALVTVLVSHSLFPDETDFRVLLALPVPQRLIFAAKLLALALFVGLFTAFSVVAMTPMAVVIGHGRWVPEGVAVRLAAHTIASVAGCMCAALAIVAVNGVIVTSVPRSRALAMSSAVRTGLLAALVLLAPLVPRLMTQGDAFATGAPALYLVPPAWFLGLERVLVGDTSPYFLRLAQMAMVAVTAAALIAVVCYIALYRRFDRVMLRASHSGRPPFASLRRPPWITGARSQVNVAIGDFIAAILRRSSLHQSVTAGLVACGAALAANSFIGADVFGWARSAGPPSDDVVAALTWAPVVLMFTSACGVRAAFALPVEHRANWVFRVTEHEGIRADELRAVAAAVRRLGVYAPVAVVFPMWWMAFGARALPAAAVAALYGSVFVEILVRDWHRIPFTCSYLPGKRAVAHSILIALVSFGFFTNIGAAIVRATVDEPIRALVFTGVLSAAMLAMQRRRLAACEATPLMFEDEPTSAAEIIRLSLD